jgi:hypothetical protein
MRCLLAALMLVMATALAQAKQAGEDRSTVRPKDPPKPPITTRDGLPMPPDARHKGRGRSAETMIPDICTGC